MVLIRISFLQCFHPWFVKVHRVHCFLACRSSISFWSIPVCASAKTLSIISCRGAAGFFAAFSSFLLAWYPLFFYRYTWVSLPLSLLVRFVFVSHLRLILRNLRVQVSSFDEIFLGLRCRCDRLPPFPVVCDRVHH